MLSKELDNYIETIYCKYDLVEYDYDEEKDYIFNESNYKKYNEQNNIDNDYMDSRIRSCNFDKCKCGYDENDYYDFIHDFNILADDFNWLLVNVFT